MTLNTIWEIISFFLFLRESPVVLSSSMVVQLSPWWRGSDPSPCRSQTCAIIFMAQKVSCPFKAALFTSQHFIIYKQYYAICTYAKTHLLFSVASTTHRSYFKLCIHTNQFIYYLMVIFPYFIFLCWKCSGFHPLVPTSVAGGSSRTFLHDELLYKILLRFLRVGWGPPGYWGDLPP